MVCIEKRPYTLYGRLATLHFRYLTCLLDRGHIIPINGKVAVFFLISYLLLSGNSFFSVTISYHVVSIFEFNFCIFFISRDAL